jgi:hypothetical protein
MMKTIEKNTFSYCLSISLGSHKHRTIAMKNYFVLYPHFNSYALTIIVQYAL